MSSTHPSPLFRSALPGLQRTAFLFLLASACLSSAAEYFVSPNGDDSSDGLKREGPFATVQRGVDALEPGDTLTILPGEYRESVRRDGLGSEAADTVIRAEVPGTAILRGDVPIQDFRKVPGTEFTFETDFDGTREVTSVNETDTLRVLDIKPNAAEMDFVSASFHQDREAGKLFLSSSDLQSASTHQYTASVIGTHGLYLGEPKRVILDGLVVTGFHSARKMERQDRSYEALYGIFLFAPKKCVVRNCIAYLNGHGIGLNMLANERDDTGDNVVESCAAWANSSQFADGDVGGISIFAPRREVVRNSVAFLNRRAYGIHIYGGLQASSLKENQAVLRDNLAWGNMCDFKIKSGTGYLHRIERCVGPGLWSAFNTSNCLIGTGASGEKAGVDNILLDQFPDLDLGAEFADPENHDFRLQSDSRFRGQGTDGGDLGPFPYQANVFYVSTDGDDSADGLSVKTAWASLRKAAAQLKSGDTLYLLPGVHQGDVEIRAEAGEPPISIFGRGRAPVRVRGGIATSGPVRLQRIIFPAEPVAYLPGGPTAWSPQTDPPPVATQELALVVPPEIHSLSPSTANIEYRTTRPALAEIAWGESPECKNQLSFTADSFASFSLKNLKPGKTYYFRIKALAEPNSTLDMMLDQTTVEGRIAIEHRVIRFTTPEKIATPQTYYVAPDGDNSHSGLDATKAWRSIAHAAGKVNAGDTVLVAPGNYPETVRIRATGTPEAPITFQALPGGKTILNGSDFSLHQGFAANSKSHLRFDGFTFVKFNLIQNSDGPWPGRNGEFVILGGEDVRISRCFADGRGGYPAHFIRAVGTKDLLVENCVMINNMSGAIILTRCPGFRMRHCVIASPMTDAMVINNLPNQTVTLEKNIFTDLLKKKSDFNFNLFPVESGKALDMSGNGFLVRSFPPAERTIFGLVDHAAHESTPKTLAAFEEEFGPTDSVFGDPIFAGAVEAAKDPANADSFLPDLMMDATRDLYFSDYFATSPAYLSQKIGLEPERFPPRNAQD